MIKRMMLLAGLSLLLIACAAEPEPAAPTDEPASTVSPDAPTPTPEPTVPAEYEALRIKVREQGTLRVIVLLNVPFTPEGDLGSEEAVRQQRAAIADAQNALIADLEGTGAAQIEVFETVPQMALTVDEEALERLISTPLVSTISEDSLDSLSP